MVRMTLAGWRNFDRHLVWGMLLGAAAVICAAIIFGGYR